MGQNSLIYGLGALVLVAAGAGWWMYTTGMPAQNGGAAVVTSEPTTERTSLTQLLGSTGSQKCTFESSTNNSSSSGAVYVAGGQLRGDFISTTNGIAVESHLIIKDDTSYVWSSALPQGIQIPLASMSVGSGVEGSVDPNAELDYSCNTWSADASVFTLPTGVEFQDLSSFMPGKI